MIPRGAPADNAAGVQIKDDGPVLTQWIQPTFARPDVADLSGPFLIGAIHSRDHALHDPAGQWIAAILKLPSCHINWVAPVQNWSHCPSGYL
jgi:hypothetical protein